MRDNRYYLLRVYRERLQYPALRRRNRDLANQHRVGRVLLERGDSGRNLYSDFAERDGRSRHRTVPPSGSKEDRLAACSAIIVEGRLYLPDSANWLVPSLDEVTGFPNTRHDDQVDSLSQFLNHMRHQPGGKLRLSPAGRRSPERRRLRPARTERPAGGEPISPPAPSSIFAPSLAYSRHPLCPTDAPEVDPDFEVAAPSQWRVGDDR